MLFLCMRFLKICSYIVIIWSELWSNFFPVVYCLLCLLFDLRHFSMKSTECLYIVTRIEITSFWNHWRMFSRFNFYSWQQALYINRLALRKLFMLASDRFSSFKFTKAILKFQTIENTKMWHNAENNQSYIVMLDQTSSVTAISFV